MDSWILKRNGAVASRHPSFLGVVALGAFVGSMISLGPGDKQLGVGVGSLRGLYSP